MLRSWGAEPQVVAEINAVQPNSGLATVRLESPTPARTSRHAVVAQGARVGAIARKVAFHTSMLEPAET
ncbi:hypothetical protein J2W27_004462 [Variovorax boronicumulans]|uniref:hypothetical protein n=1 Tax=Variovorax boronicumulans TaxID=436515 RepID=UPI002781F8A8|nr:hypothetical protein [Variovorax boronicumulans]MDP9912336.1 hypothetical protein [Variovorax boronicumulans]